VKRGRRYLPPFLRRRGARGKKSLEEMEHPFSSLSFRPPRGKSTKRERRRCVIFSFSLSRTTQLHKKKETWKGDRVEKNKRRRKDRSLPVLSSILLPRKVEIGEREEKGLKKKRRENRGSGFFYYLYLRRRGEEEKSLGKRGYRGRRRRRPLFRRLLSLSPGVIRKRRKRGRGRLIISSSPSIPPAGT